MKKPRVLLAINRRWFSSVLSPDDLNRLRTIADVLNDDPPAQITKDFLIKNLREADIALTSWDTALA